MTAAADQGPAVPPPPRPPRDRSRRGRDITIGVVGGVVLLGLIAGGAWAVASVIPGVTGWFGGPVGGGPSTGARTLAGPPVYVGDEVDGFVFDDGDVRELFPASTGYERGDVLYSTGELEGLHTEPAACITWIARLAYPTNVAGIRTARWESSGAEEPSSVIAVQYPTVDTADAEWASLDAAVAECASFRVEQYDDTLISDHTFTMVAERPGVLVFDVGVREATTGAERRSRWLVAHEGNVVVSAAGLDADGDAATADDLASAMQGRIDRARADLTERIGYR